MIWGNFTVTHIVSLVIAIGIIVGLYFVLRNRSDKVKTAVLFVLSLSGISAIIFNLVKWGSPLEYLPFHLCSISAIVLPIAVITRSKILNNLLCLWSLGALCALIMNNGQANFEIFSDVFAFYYFPHIFEFGIPILMFALKLTKKDYKTIISTLIITFVTYTAIHFINVAINAYCANNNILDPSGALIIVNYMYSITPSIPILEFFWKIIPHSYYYLLIVLPIIVLYLGLLYTPQFIKVIKSKNA